MIELKDFLKTLLHSETSENDVVIELVDAEDLPMIDLDFSLTACDNAETFINEHQEKNVNTIYDLDNYHLEVVYVDKSKLHVVGKLKATMEFYDFDLGAE